MNNELNKISFIWKNENNKPSFSHANFMRFLSEKGIKKVKVDSDPILVLVKDFIVTKIDPLEIKSMVLDEVRKLKDDSLTDYILENTGLFNMTYLNAIDSVEAKIHRDKSYESHFYFKNGVVTVTKDGVKPLTQYSDFKKYIWHDHIVQRNYNPVQTFGASQSVFEDFISKLSGSDEQRFKRMCSVIGFCLHDYKTPAKAKAIILEDERISANPDGGSGKSLIVLALSQLRKTVINDGKSFDTRASFAWQKVDNTVRILCIDDVRHNFNFEDLFSVITAGFRNINKKHKGEIELPLEESPTIILTTNSILKGNSGSFARRQHRVEISPYFNRNRAPFDEYNGFFFTEWDSEEWDRFHDFMLDCVRFYLKNGVVECNEVDYRTKELIRATSQSFAEWIDDNIELLSDPNGIGTKHARDEYMESTNQRNSPLSDKKFSDYIKTYCNLFNYEYVALTNMRPRGFYISEKK